MKVTGGKNSIPPSVKKQISESNYISRDLSWIKFNDRVLDQVRDTSLNIFERLKFLSITSSNLDEFCTIRLGNLYNYLDFGKPRFDYCGLRETPFRLLLLKELNRFITEQHSYYVNFLKPQFQQNGFNISSYESLSVENKTRVDQYFQSIIYPMLTPMVYDSYHTFPTLKNNSLLLGVVTYATNPEHAKICFIQIPTNLSRFFEIPHSDIAFEFVPLEDIVINNVQHLFRNVNIQSVSLFRINRNGDFTLDESDDIESNFLEELKRKIKTRRSGRVVRMDLVEGANENIIRLLKIQWDLDDQNIIMVPKDSLIDFTGMNQIAFHREFKDQRKKPTPHVLPLTFPEYGQKDLFEVLKSRDILLHHPYNSIEPVVELLEKAADDPFVLSIKITIYRLAKKSRVSDALLKAAENGKHVSVLFEVKARFDEENNLKEAKRLQKAGCFVIYGYGAFKTHTKLLLIVRREPGDVVFRYSHFSSGNYNEVTAEQYTDISLLTSKETYSSDVSEFFNVITGHSNPKHYRNLITAPNEMRNQLCALIRAEAENAKQGLTSGIVIKVNSVQDKEFIDTLYEASQAGVPIKLIVRGMCCLRPGKKKLSETIEVISIIGEFLEHSRIYYFHNQGNPKVYIGSADAMVRSFDRRLESLVHLEEDILRQQAMNILKYNLMDNTNSYNMKMNGSYEKKELNGHKPFNIHKKFFSVTPEIISKVKLF